MKIIPGSLSILLLVFVITLDASAQTTGDYSLIETYTLKINGKVNLGDSESVVRSEFGSPDAVKEKYFEISDETMNVLQYSNSKFFIDHQDRMSYFVVKGPDFVFSYNGTPFKVGDPISAVSGIMATSYAGRKGGSLMAVFAVKKNGVMQQTDSYIVIEYNTSDRITKIRQWENFSLGFSLLHR